MKGTFIYSILLFTVCQLYAQRPVINAIDKSSASYNQTVFITGSNFPANTADVSVYFGSGEASVVSSSANLLEVTVPITATYGSITVENLSNGLIGKSMTAFTPSFKGDGFNASSISAQSNFSTNQQYTYDICSCDFDKDGKPDLAVTNNESSVISLFRNSSTHTSLSYDLTEQSIARPTIDISCGDLNGDNLPDLVAISESQGSQDVIFTFENTSTPGSISFTTTVTQLPVKADGNSSGRSIKISDIDSDGKPDIVIGVLNDPKIYVYRNTVATVGGSLSWSNPVGISLSGLGQTGAIQAGMIAVGDLNGDGLDDLGAFGFAKSSNIVLLRNNSTPGNISLAQELTVVDSDAKIDMMFIDLDNDNKREIVTTSNLASGREISISKNTSTTGSFSFDTKKTVSASGSFGVSAADLDGDGLVDLATASVSSRVHVVINNGNLDFTTNTISTSLNARNLVTIDANGDFKPDILFTNNSNTASVGRIRGFLNQNCMVPEISPSGLTFCLGDSFTLSATESPGTTYTWSSTGDVTFSQDGSNQATITVTSGTSATIEVTVNPPVGSCAIPGSTNLTLTPGSPPSAPIINLSNTGTICSGTAFNLSGPAGFDEYIWTLPSGTITTLTTNTLSINNSSSLDAGTYELRVRNNGSCAGDPNSRAVTINEPPMATIANRGTDNFCVGSSTTLEVIPYSGISYQWNLNGSPIATAQNTSYSAMTTGNYSVTLTDADGCALTSSAYSVNAVSPPTASITSAAEICVGTALPVSASGSSGTAGFTLNHSWDFGNGTNGIGENTTVTYASASSPTIQLTTGYESIAGCTNSTTKSITVSNAPTPASISALVSPSASSREKCPEDELLLTAPTGYQSYSFLVDGSEVSNTNTASIGTGAGIDLTEVTLNVVTAIGCQVNGALLTVSNFANSRIIIEAPDHTISTENSIQLSDTESSVRLSATNGSGYAWEPAAIIDDATSSEVTVFPTTQSTTIYVTGTDVTNNCVTMDSVTILTPGIIPRQSFSPNGDGIGYDCWEILNSSNLDGCTVHIFDQRGVFVFKGDSPFENNCVWNGNINNGSSEAPEGVYYFVLKCDEGSNSTSGYILLGR